MKNTVQFGQNLAKLPEILFAHSSRNRHFETELYSSLKHTYKITHNIHKIHRYTCEMFILWHQETENEENTALQSS